MGHQVCIPVMKKARVDERQADNIRTLIDASSVFFQEFGMEEPHHPDMNGEIAVLESGHQPNFLPYPGIFRKVFALQALAGTAMNNDIPAIAFFGFADQNLSTAPLLFSNRVPSVTRDGFEKIGFKISEEDRWKQFCCVDTPTRDTWEKKMGRLRDFYLGSIQGVRGLEEGARERTDRIFDLLERCYGGARNFADLNACIFTAICREILGLDRIFFFRYSDVQNGHIFAEEARRLVLNRGEYIDAHNRAVADNPSIGLSPLPPDHVPFWYHCTCGRKLELRETESSFWSALCDACGKEYLYDMDPDAGTFGTIYDRLGFTAISRNLAFSEGLGVAIFISGTGGSLHYGAVSSTISQEIGFHAPCTLAWGGRDYYLGPLQKKALYQVKQIFSLKDSDLMDDALAQRITSHIKGLSLELDDLGPDEKNKETRKRLAGKLTQARTQVDITRRLFSINPSILDLLVSVEQNDLISAWQDAIDEGEFTKKGKILRLQKDCVYPGGQGIAPASIPGIQTSLVQLGACQ